MGPRSVLNCIIIIYFGQENRFNSDSRVSWMKWLCSVRLELSVFLLLCAFHIIPLTNSLGNHTVNRWHSFGVVFEYFDKEYQNNQDFWQNISNPACCSAFFTYTLFYWKICQLGEILDLLSQNDVENMIIIQALCVWIERFTSFSTVNPRFLQDDLFSSKKSVYMKNAEQRAGFETFCRKSCFFKYSLSKSTKTTPKWRPNLHYTSLEMTKSDLWNMIFPDREAQTGSKGPGASPLRELTMTESSEVT